MYKSVGYVVCSRLSDNNLKFRNNDGVSVRTFLTRTLLSFHSLNLKYRHCGHKEEYYLNF